MVMIDHETLRKCRQYISAWISLIENYDTDLAYNALFQQTLLLPNDDYDIRTMTKEMTLALQDIRTVYSKLVNL